MPTITLNPTVGVAPGTTTMTLGEFRMGPGPGGPDGNSPWCPSDEWPDSVFVNSPQMTEGPAPGMSGLGQHRWDPYTDWPSLKGLQGAGMSLSDTRWGLVIAAGVAAFAVTFGLLYLRRRKR